MSRTAIPKACQSRASGLVDLVHRLLSVTSKGGARYFVTVIDNKSHWVSVHPIRVNSDWFAAFRRFQSAADRQTWEKIKPLQSDGGGEYTSNEFRGYRERSGVSQKLTGPHIPQQNGVAERMNCTLKDLMRSMLLHKNVSHEFWADAVSTAAHIRNSVTSRSIPADTTPHSLWYGNKPDVSPFCVFGSRCWYKHNRPGQRSLESQSSEALLPGYATG